MRPKYDMLWKGMIEEIMEDLLLFVDADIGKKLDLERGFEFLDKELAELYPEPETPSRVRVVDKLVKAFLRDGSEHWMLFHIEVQGNNGKDFPRRMFEYFSRIFGKYGRPVAAVAVMTGKNGDKMPATFEDQCLWTRVLYEYKTLSITDYSDKILEASKNPFSLVLLVAREVLLNRTDEGRDYLLLEKKLKIASLLKERLVILGEEKANAILLFLKNYVVFNKPETNRIFMERTDQLFGKGNTMGIFDQFAEIKHREGVEVGHRAGVRKGRKEGLEKAIRGLLVKTEFSQKKIAELLGVPVAMVKKIRSELNG